MRNIRVDKKVLDSLNNWLKENEFVIVEIDINDEEFKIIYYDEIGNKRIEFFS